MTRSLTLALAAIGAMIVLPVAAPAQGQTNEQQTNQNQTAPEQTAPEQTTQPMGLQQYVSTAKPPQFDDPQKALTALKDALAADDFAKLASLLGLDGEKLKSSDGVMDTFALMKEGAARRLGLEEDGDRMIVNIGEILWPLPFPLVKAADGKWSFDTKAGIEEIANRRVGENELQAIATLRDYVEAQEDYALFDRDGDGVLEYAQKLVSSPGGTDGLYWPSDQGDGESPAGDVDQEQLDKARAGNGYFGYKFKILTRQGANIAGGQYDYVINGNMIAGFGVVAWPAIYGETGVHTFVVNRNGIVYQADLGDDTEKLASDIRQFNPNDNWEVTGD